MKRDQFHLLLAGAILLAGCALTTPSNAQTSPSNAAASSAAMKAIKAAVAAPSRTPKNVARDKYRHPAQTLAFFGVTGDQTILEFMPAGGWYTEILAPLIKAGGGTYYAASAPGGVYEATRKKLASDPAVYGDVKLLSFPPGDAVPAGSVDTVLTFRNIHNMVMGGTAEETFKTFYRLLKPGGVLGVVDHRLPEDRDSALQKKIGYLKVSTVEKLAEQAGFVLDGSSQINANPKDTANWPKGVWTLPPTYALGDKDHAKYAAIGESDRMTLRFRKPAK